MAFRPTANWNVLPSLLALWFIAIPILQLSFPSVPRMYTRPGRHRCEPSRCAWVCAGMTCGPWVRVTVSGPCPPLLRLSQSLRFLKTTRSKESVLEYWKGTLPALVAGFFILVMLAGVGWRVGL